MRVPIGLSAMDAAGVPLPTVDGTSLHPETPSDRRLRDQPMTDRMSDRPESGQLSDVQLSDVQMSDLHWYDHRSSSLEPSDVDQYRGGRQWSDRDPSDPVLDASAGHRATLLGIRSGSPAKLRRKAREAALREPSERPIRDDSDPTPLFTSTRYTATDAQLPAPPVADQQVSELEALTSREPAAPSHDAPKPEASSRRGPETEGSGPAELRGARVRSRGQAGGDPASGGSHAGSSRAARNRSSVDGGRHAAASTGRHAIP
jgi:hypothetical protein